MFYKKNNRQVHRSTFILFYILLFIFLVNKVQVKAEKIQVSYSSLSGEHILEIDWNLNQFKQSALQYNSSLARTSLGLSAASYKDLKQERPNTYIDTALKQMGFENIEHNINNGKNTVGYSIAFQKLDNEEFLFVVVLQGTQEMEWYGNFNVADGIYNKNKSLSKVQTHESFDRASNVVVNKLNRYIEKQIGDNKKIKIWITGHSRGAAVANLTAAKLIELKIYKKRNIFVYTFAAPNVSTKAVPYKNIYNLVNGEDLITYCPLEQGWNFKRYGVTYLFPIKPYTEEKVYQRKLKEMKSVYQKQTNSLYKGNIMQSVKPLANLVKELNKLAGNVEEYYSKRYIILDNKKEEKYSLREYFDLVASLITKSEVVETKLLINSINSPFKPIANYLTINTINGQIIGAHMPDTYISWLEVTDENELIDLSKVAVFK